MPSPWLAGRTARPVGGNRGLLSPREAGAFVVSASPASASGTTHGLSHVTRADGSKVNAAGRRRNQKTAYISFARSANTSSIGRIVPDAVPSANTVPTPTYRPPFLFTTDRR